MASVPDVKLVILGDSGVGVRLFSEKVLIEITKFMFIFVIPRNPA